MNFIKLGVCQQISSYEGGVETTRTEIEDEWINLDHIVNLHVPSGFVIFSNGKRASLPKESMEKLQAHLEAQSQGGSEDA